MQDLDLYCRSYGDQNNSFHLKAMRAAQKNKSNIFLKIKIKIVPCCIGPYLQGKLRFIPFRVMK
jgi:hypothetical protein